MKKVREERWEASVRSFASQKSKTLDLANLLKEDLVGGSVKITSGEGREYLAQISLICKNQDFSDRLELANVSHAYW